MSSGLKTMIEDLITQGWALNPRFLEEGEWRSLLDLWSSLAPHAQAARINKHKLRRPEIRGDSILWLDRIEQLAPSAHQSLKTSFWPRVDALQNELNRQLFLNLRHFEAHFAHYPSGAGYQAHYDQPRREGGRAENLRLLSFVLYLNPEWTPEQEGELILWKDESQRESLARIEPRAGQAVLFRSDQVFHEVRSTQGPRLAITGWFRRESPNPLDLV